MGRAIPTQDFNMGTQVANYPVYLILLLGSYAIIPVQATACPNTVTKTEISLATQHHYPLPCYEPECPREFVCPNDSCQTAYVTRTMILPFTASVLPASSATPCAFNSCLPPVQETVCELTFSATP